MISVMEKFDNDILKVYEARLDNILTRLPNGTWHKENAYGSAYTLINYLYKDKLNIVKSDLFNLAHQDILMLYCLSSVVCGMPIVNTYLDIISDVYGLSAKEQIRFWETQLNLNPKIVSSFRYKLLCVCKAKNIDYSELAQDKIRLISFILSLKDNVSIRHYYIYNNLTALCKSVNLNITYLDVYCVTLEGKERTSRIIQEFNFYFNTRGLNMEYINKNWGTNLVSKVSSVVLEYYSLDELYNLLFKTIGLDQSLTVYKDILSKTRKSFPYKFWERKDIRIISKQLLNYLLFDYLCLDVEEVNKLNLKKILKLYRLSALLNKRYNGQIGDLDKLIFEVCIER